MKRLLKTTNYCQYCIVGKNKTWLILLGVDCVICGTLIYSVNGVIKWVRFPYRVKTGLTGCWGD